MLDEQVTLGQRTIELQEESNALLRKATEQQQEMLRLLGRLTGQGPPSDGTPGAAVQLPQVAPTGVRP